MLQPIPVTTPPRSALVVLEEALGVPLRDVADAATGRASLRIAPGRVGATYPSTYLAGIDFTAARLEEQRDDAKARLRAALNVCEANEIQRLIGEDGQGQRAAERERATVEQIEARLRAIARLGPPLAKRAALLDLQAVAEAELIAVTAEHEKWLPGLAEAKRVLGDDELPAMGEARRKRAYIETEHVLRERVIRAEDDVTDARHALRLWAAEHPEIAASLARRPVS